jgi:[ribosomal protein S18]-alanine N-acetyltransferase
VSAAPQLCVARLREMRAEDAPTIAAIEHASYDFPWTEGIFRDCLRVGYKCRVLCAGEALIGYAVLAIGAGEAHLLNLCVRAERRCAGHGHYLLERMIELARSDGADRIFLEVRPSNDAGRRLYQRAGFEEIGRRPRYYQALLGREDALVLARALHADDD